MTDTSNDLLPFGEHADMRKAYEAEVAKWKGIVKGVHGALADLGDIPVPALDADIYDTVMSIRAKDAELIQMLVDAIAYSRKHGPPASPSDCHWDIALFRALTAASERGFKPSNP